MKMLLPVKQEFSDSEDENSCNYSSTSNCDFDDNPVKSEMRQSDINKRLSFTNLEGVHTGVPTRTTATLTPTRLRLFEQDILELPQETERPEPHHNEAGFVPPLVETITQGKNTFLNLVDKSGFGGYTTISPAPTMNRHAVASPPQIPLLQSAPQQTRRNMGGRRPTKSTGISPEEEERRQVRRERNKLAAARCRKRRMDHTNELVQETDGLEQKRQQLQSEIQGLQTQKEHLEFLLEAHKANCRLLGTEQPPQSPPELKPLVYGESRVMVQPQPRCDAAALSSQPALRRPQLGATAGNSKPSRPSSLPVAAKPVEVAGVPITTPSSVIPFNFDSLMDGGTGLTPVSGTGLSPMIPSCSTQQRNTGVDLASPDNSCPPKLVSL